jgi:class 3 adenylate cyclase
MQSFFALVDQLNACSGAERARAEEAVWSRFGVEKAILALDMSEFSLSVRRNGIMSYLGSIRRMQIVTEPIVRASGGEVVKYLADNLMAVFDRAGDAVRAAVRINQALAEARDGISVSIGIDYGRFLMVPGKDCYGDPINIAYKLGEDLARPSEILITAAARERLEAGFPHALSEQQVSFSGLQVTAYGVLYS